MLTTITRVKERSQVGMAAGQAVNPTLLLKKNVHRLGEDQFGHITLRMRIKISTRSLLHLNMLIHLALPTTSSVVYPAFLRSDSHPSLISKAAVRRLVLCNALKKHRRMPSNARASDLTSVLTAINDYVPYLYALEAGLAGKQIQDEEIDVVLEKELDVEWRPVLLSNTIGKMPRRVKGKGLDYEICFTLCTLGYVHSLLAREQLRQLYANSIHDLERRAVCIAQASKHLTQANSVHESAAARAADLNLPVAAVDVSPAAQDALARSCLAEATLLAILKDDPYPAVLMQSQDRDDREWMYKAPTIPKVRAHLFARLSLRAAEHASTAAAVLGGSGRGGKAAIDDDIRRYFYNLERVAKAKACRFLGIDADLDGKTGTAIGWLQAGRKQLGIKINEKDGGQRKGFSKLKSNWKQRREEKKVQKGGEWGADAGAYEESMILDMLEERWAKANGMV